MKKPVIMIFGCLLALALFAALAGCGSGDTAKAKQYMKAGDEQLQKAMTATSEWQNQISTLGSATDPAAIESGAQKAKESAATAGRYADAAKAEYKKIDGLSGVESYKKYADLRIKEIDTVMQIITRVDEALDKALAMANSGDVTGLPALWQQVSNGLKPLSEQGQKLEEQAAKIKTEKKL
jgi:hypothetical protein